MGCCFTKYDDLPDLNYSYDEYMGTIMTSNEPFNRPFERMPACFGGDVDPHSAEEEEIYKFQDIIARAF